MPLPKRAGDVLAANEDATREALAVTGINPKYVSPSVADPPAAPVGTLGAKRTDTGGIVRLERLLGGWVPRGDAIPGAQDLDVISSAIGYLLSDPLALPVQVNEQVRFSGLHRYLIDRSPAAILELPDGVENKPALSPAGNRVGMLRRTRTPFVTLEDFGVVRYGEGGTPAQLTENTRIVQAALDYSNKFGRDVVVFATTQSKLISVSGSVNVPAGARLLMGQGYYAGDLSKVLGCWFVYVGPDTATRGYWRLRNKCTDAHLQINMHGALHRNSTLIELGHTGTGADAVTRNFLGVYLVEMGIAVRWGTASLDNMGALQQVDNITVTGKISYYRQNAFVFDGASAGDYSTVSKMAMLAVGEAQAKWLEAPTTQVPRPARISAVRVIQAGQVTFRNCGFAAGWAAFDLRDGVWNSLTLDACQAEQTQWMWYASNNGVAQYNNRIVLQGNTLVDSDVYLGGACHVSSHGTPVNQAIYMESDFARWNGFDDKLNPGDVFTPSDGYSATHGRVVGAYAHHYHNQAVRLPYPYERVVLVRGTVYPAEVAGVGTVASWHVVQNGPHLPGWYSGVFAVGDRIQPSGRQTGDWAYVAETAGQVGATEPIWPNALNATVQDGAVRWRAVMEAGIMLPTGIIGYVPYAFTRSSGAVTGVNPGTWEHLPIAAADHPNWDNATNEWICPQTAVYSITTMIRYLDGSQGGPPAGNGYASSFAATGNGDGQTWFAAAPNRNSAQSTRQLRISRGTRMGLYTYLDGATVYPVTRAEIQINRVF
jgi:hypothetical protein